MLPLYASLAEDFDWSWFWSDRDIILLEIAFVITAFIRIWLVWIQGAYGNEPIEFSGSWSDATKQRPSTLVAVANATMWLLAAAIVALVLTRMFL